MFKQRVFHKKYHLTHLHRANIYIKLKASLYPQAVDNYIEGEGHQVGVTNYVSPENMKYQLKS